MSKNKNDKKFEVMKSEKLENENFHILNAGRSCVLRYIIAKEKEVETEEKNNELKYKPKAKIKEVDYVNIVKESEMYLKKIIPFCYFFCLFNPIKANDPLCCEGYGKVQMVVIGMQKNMKNILKTEDGESTEENEEDYDDDEEYENFVIPNSPYIKTFLNDYCICQTSPLSEDKFLYVYSNVKEAIWNERVEFQIHNPYSTLRIELADFDATKGVLNSFDDVFGYVKLQTNLLIPNQIYDITLELPYLRTQDYPASNDIDSAVYGNICQTAKSPFYTKNETKTKSSNNNEVSSNIKSKEYDIYNKRFCATIKDMITLPIERMRINRNTESPSAHEVKQGKQSKNDSDSYSDLSSLLPYDAFLKDDFFNCNILSKNDTTQKQLLPFLSINTDSSQKKRKKKGYIIRILIQLQVNSFINELFACTLPSPKKKIPFNKINFLELWKDVIILKTFVFDMYIMSIVRAFIDVYERKNILVSFFMLFLWIFGCLYSKLIFPLFFLLLSFSLYLLPSDRITIDGKNVDLCEKMKDKYDIELEYKNKREKKNDYKMGSDGSMQSSLLKSMLSSAVSSDMQFYFAKLHYYIIQITQGFTGFLLILQKKKKKLSALFLVCGILSWAFPSTVNFVIKCVFLISGSLILTKDIYIFDVLYRLLIGLLKFFYLKRSQMKKQHLFLSPPA